MGDSSTIEIGGDYDDLEKALGESSSLFEEFGDDVERVATDSASSWAKVGTSISQSLSAVKGAWDSLCYEIESGFNDVWANIKNGTQEFIKQSEEVRRLGANLRATGAVAGFTAGGLEQMNEQLKNLSVNGSEAIRSAQMALLQFKNVRGDIFKDAIKGAMDFAAVTGGTLSSATEHFGRLLDDPRKGLADLVDEGIRFTAMQVQMIEKMEKADDIIGLQRMLLDKLAEMYGGEAKRQAEGLWGSIERLNNIFKDMWTTIGSLLAPTLNSKLVPVMEKVGKIVKFLVDQIGSDGKMMGDAFDYALKKAQEWGEVLLDVGLKAFAVLHTAVTDWEVTWKAAWAGLKLAAVESLIYVLEKAKQLGEFLASMWGHAKAAMAPVWELALAGMEMVKAALGAVADFALSMWNGVVAAATWAWDTIGKKVVDWAFVAIGAGFLAYHFFTTFFKTVYELGSLYFTGLVTIVEAFALQAGAAIYLLTSTAKTLFDEVYLVVTTVFTKCYQATVVVFGWIYEVIKNSLTPVLMIFDLLGFNVESFAGLTKEYLKTVLDVFLAVFSGISGGASTVFGQIFDYLKMLGFTIMDNLFGDVKAAMKPAFDAMDKIGQKFGEAKDKAAAAAADMRAKWDAAFGGMGAPDLDQIIADLKAKTGQMGGDFDKAFDAFKDKFAANLGTDEKVLDAWKKKLKDAMDASEDPTTHLADDQFRFPGDKDKKDKSGSGKSPFEALDQIRRRIEDAAASPEAEATNKQSQLMQKLHDQQQGKLDELIDAVDPDKRSGKTDKMLRMGQDRGLFRLGSGMGM